MAPRGKPDSLARLHRVATAARAAEEGRLAAVTAGIARCRERAAALRRALAEPMSGGEAAWPGLGERRSGDLAMAARWQARLGSEARAEEARAEALGREAREARERLARALGRERVLAELLERSRREARRAAERRAEGAPFPARVAPQSSSPEREPEEGDSAGSPGMA